MTNKDSPKSVKYTTCPWKGEGSYLRDILLDREVNEDLPGTGYGRG